MDPIATEANDFIMDLARKDLQFRKINTRAYMDPIATEAKDVIMDLQFRKRYKYTSPHGPDCNGSKRFPMKDERKKWLKVMNI